MANRSEDFGMDVALTRKLNSKYEPAAEQEVIGWIQQVTGDRINPGRENVYEALKSGQILCKLVNAVYNGTGQLPPAAQRIKRPIKFTAMNAPFKQMENIQNFLDASLAYGVPLNSLFQTVDLFECRNMAQVLTTILQLGTECQRNGFNGPMCGSRPTTENRRQFNEATLRMGEGVIGLQAGTNKLASQKGMSIGAVRHIADMKVADMAPESHSVIGLQAGTNQCASQKGMSMGGVRHIADIRVDDMSRESHGTIGMQAGFTGGASQKGMSFGGQRHIADSRAEDACREGQSIISLQYGTNKCASQKGMSMGGQRHIADIKTDEMSRDGASIIGLQMGTAQNQVASQSGMTMGGQRQIAEHQPAGVQPMMMQQGDMMMQPGDMMGNGMPAYDM